MFVRSAIRRTTYADVMAKTAANTKGSAGSTGASVSVLAVIFGTVTLGFGVNRMLPSTTPLHKVWYYGVS